MIEFVFRLFFAMLGGHIGGKCGRFITVFIGSLIGASIAEFLIVML